MNRIGIFNDHDNYNVGVLIFISADLKSFLA